MPELLPFQEEGVRYLLERQRAFLADEMGLGKTVQALAALHRAQAYPAVVVCRASLKIHWQREAHVWAPGASTRIVYGRKPDHSPLADINIINYEILKQHHQALAACKAVVIDESQHVQNERAQCTRAAKALARPRSALSYVFLLTGTPLKGKTHNLISQLDILDCLNTPFRGRTHFEARYCQWYEFECQGKYGPFVRRAYVKGKNLEELGDIMRQHCMIRRLKSEVLPQLPPKRRGMWWVDLPMQDLKEYRAVKKEAVENDVPIHALITRLRQLVGLAKVKAAVEWAQSAIEEGQCVLLWAHHRSVGSALSDALGCPWLAGGLSEGSRQAMIDEFQAGEHKAMVCSITAANAGLTLTAASNALFVEQDWDPSTNLQCEDRCHRHGQLKAVNITYMGVPGTIDTHVFRLLREKNETAGRVLHEDIARAMTEEA